MKIGDTIADFDNPFLIPLLKKYSKKDIASAAQITLEKVFLKHLEVISEKQLLAVSES